MQFVDDGFDAIAVRVKNKRSKIIFAIFGMQSRSAVIFSAIFERGFVECPNRFSRWCSKGNMETFAGYGDI